LQVWKSNPLGLSPLLFKVDRILWRAIFDIALNGTPTTSALNCFFQDPIYEGFVSGHLQPLAPLKLIGYEGTFYSTTPSGGGLTSLFLVDKETKRKLSSDGPPVSPKKTQLNQKGNDDSPLVSHTKRKNLKRKLVGDSPPVSQKKTRKCSPDIEMSGK
jgi:hypothetical protein